MPRGLSTAAKTYTGPRWWTAVITTPLGTVHRFYDGPSDSMVIAGTAHAARLRVTERFRRTRSPVVEGGAFTLDDTDNFFDALLAAEANWEGGTCVVSQFLIGIDTLVEIFRGKLTEQRRARGALSFRLRPESDAGQVRVPRLALNSLCEWHFAKGTAGGPCGYDNAGIAVTVNLSDRTSTAATAQSITDSTLAESVNAHIDRVCFIITGAQRGRGRAIRSNTATAFTFYQPLPSSPAIGDKFIVLTANAGIPKLLKKATSGVLESAVATTATARTIGDSSLAMTTDEHKSDGTEANAGLVKISAGTGAGQIRRIGSNTGTTITIHADEPDFSPAPSTSDSKFMVLHRFCPKDVFDACENRGRVHSFNGFPTLTPDLARQIARFNPAPAGGPVGGGGGGGSGGGSPLGGGGGSDGGGDLEFFLT